MFIKFKRQNLASQGDTIVEVLLCIAVIGAVIVGAYALASRSLQEGVAASERSEAVKLAEGQIEALKFRQRADTNWQTNFATAASINNHCLNINSKSPTDTVDTWLPLNNSNPNILSLAGYNAVCASPTGNVKYFININMTHGSCVPVTDCSPTYKVTVKWLPEGGGPQSETKIYYRF